MRQKPSEEDSRYQSGLRIQQAARLALSQNPPRLYKVLARSRQGFAFQAELAVRDLTRDRVQGGHGGFKCAAPACALSSAAKGRSRPNSGARRSPAQTSPSAPPSSALVLSERPAGG